MLTQQDIIEQHEHYDAVSFGGWSIDLHPADGVYGAGRACNQWHSKGIYQIPYRCLVTPDADNLFIGGRIISVSHVANGSTRVMCTAAHGGQAIGMAAAIALRDHLKPADLIGRERMGQLQSALLRTGHFLPGERFGRGMLPPKARISASSEFALERLRPGRHIPLRARQADGVPACKQMLNELMQGDIQGNFLEGMGCVGGCVGGPKRLIPRGEGALHVAHYGEAAPVRTPVDNPYVMELLYRLGYESVESLTQEDTMFRRQF